MKYRNVITGTIVDVKSKLSGAWEQIDSAPNLRDDKVEPKSSKKRVMKNECDNK